MLDYVLSYLENRGAFAQSAREQEDLERGICLYLKENGILEHEESPYYLRYLSRSLARIEPEDLLAYFTEYPVISRIRQIAAELDQNSFLTPDRIQELYWLQERLCRAGLGNRYIPHIAV